MSLLLRTALRHHTNGLSCLLRTHQIRPICVSSIKFNETKQNKNDSASAVTRSSAGNNADVSTNVRPIGERIKENTKTASYMGVILVGIAVTAALLGTIARELMMSGSPNNVYSAALAVCIDDPRVQDALGPPIKAYGEETRRRRRQHVAHKIYVRNSEPYIQMHFYIQGIRNKATVQLECRLNDGKYRYLFVQLDHYPHTTIIIEDNRQLIDTVAEMTPSPQTENSFKF